VYDPHRLEKGGVRWHTVEGPFVLKFKGRYYQMYSGGNWQNTSYGVSYAAAPRIDALEEWEQLEHTGTRPLVLRTLPGQVIGPGHNSVVRGPDNLQLFCVYHRWAHDGSGRLPAIDRLEWAGDRISVLGPSTTPQPAPIPPGISGFTGFRQRCGDWLLDPGSARHSSREHDCSASLPVRHEAFVLETSVRLEGSGGAGIALAGGYGRSLTLWLLPAELAVEQGSDFGLHAIEVSPPFRASDWHELRLEVDGTLVCARLDGLVRWQGRVRAPVSAVELVTSAAAAEFSGLAVTAGWQELFMDPGADLAALGWVQYGDRGAWEVRNSQLACGAGVSSALLRQSKFESYEAVVNVRPRITGQGDAFGIMPALTSDGRGPLLTLTRGESGPVLEVRDLSGGDPAVAWRTAAVREMFQLPAGKDMLQFLHFRFRKLRGRLEAALEAYELGQVDAPLQETTIGLLACGTPATCDSLRVTAYPDCEKGE
jgi:hypothetical protein